MAAQDRPRRALVLDGDQPAALAIVRSLGRRGITVDAGERKAGFLSSYSRFLGEALIYPDPLTDAAGFFDTIQRRVREVPYDLIIPVAEDTVQPLAARRGELEGLTRLAIAPTESLERMLDKAKTFELARRLGVPVPASFDVSSEAQLAELAPTLRYPVVVKPSRSIAGAGARTKLSVAYAHDARSLLALSSERLKLGPVILQEYFRGAGVGVEILADRGEVVYAFSHKRLHELPLTGGGSCLRVSVPVNPALLEHAKTLIKATSWHGVAMVEFKLDEATGECRLMEVNGRFWGSLPLAVAAGADFPGLLFDLLVDGRRPDPARRAPALGVVARKLSSDVYWYVQVLRPDQDDPLIEWPSRRRALGELLLAFSPRHRFDVQTLDDPRPGVVDAVRTGGWFVDRALDVVRREHVRRLQEKERRRGQFFERRLAGAKELLFVCYGNINRSVLAERHLASLTDRLSIRSAGFHEHGGRPADPSMVREAGKHGLSLGGARSHVLDRETVERADVILAMEVSHLVRLFHEYPAARKKAFLIACASPEVPLEIADPYGGDEATFARTYAEITACTRAIAERLPRRETPRAHDEHARSP